MITSEAIEKETHEPQTPCEKTFRANMSRYAVSQGTSELQRLLRTTEHAGYVSFDAVTHRESETL